jgi:D-alanine--poly(phosphoribitol) ligase subunit 1
VPAGPSTAPATGRDAAARAGVATPAPAPAVPPQTTPAVPFTPAQTKEPRQLVRLVNQARCTIWFSVPSLLVYLLTTRALTADDFPTTIRKIIFGGEGFPKAKLRQLYDLFGNRAELENVYGPTECTCICSAHTIVPDDFADMQQLTTLEPLAQNFDGDILPLDESNPEFGELFLRGPQVGLGYYNDPECTARSFIQNPRHTRYLDIGYRTGDLVLRDAQGRLHFKGRTDFQIKHMGYRIELEEIEAALGTLTDVAECAVIYQKLGEGLGQILVFSALHQPASAEVLLLQLAALLPTYMLPRRIHLLESLPKNANGKIDRPALLQLIEKETAS